MRRFKIGDKVRRNHNADDLEDGNNVSYGDTGIITELYHGGTTYDYLVVFKNQLNWWIRDVCLDLLEPETQASKEQKVIAKIKYLNEKYAKSRTVPTQMVDAKQGELGASTPSTGCEAPRIQTPPTGFRHPDYVAANAIRSETTRLRGIDASVELYGYRVASILFGELRAE